MLRTIAGFLALLISSSAFGQSAVLQGGGWTAGRAPMYVGSGSGQAVVQDSGPAGGGASGLGFRELLLVARGTGTPPYVAQGTGPGGTNFCNYDAPTTNATGYHYICMSPNATVAGVTGSIITAGSGGAAASLPLYLCSNGTCTTPTGGIAGLTVGTTTVAGGTNGYLLYNNSGVLGNIAASALIPTLLPTVFYVKNYGASASNPDNTAAIQAAITAAQAAAPAQVVFDCVTYPMSSNVNVTVSNVSLIGCPGRNTTLLVTSGSGTAVQFTGSATGPVFISNIEIRDIKVTKSVTSTGGVGVVFFYTTLAKAQNVWAENFFIGISHKRATNTIIENALATINQNINGAIGFDYDGTGVGAGGNASSVCTNCWADLAAGTNGKGFNLYGNYISDLIFNEPSTAGGAYGAYIDYSAALPLSAGADNVHFNTPHFDNFKTAGLSCTGLSGPGLLSINGGWSNSGTGVGTFSNFLLDTCRGVSIVNHEFYGIANSAGAITNYGVNATNSANLTVTSGKFVDLKAPIALTATVNSNISSNSFYNATGAVGAAALTLSGISTGNTISGNNFDGAAGIFTYGINAGVDASNNTFVGNTANSAAFTTSVVNDVSSGGNRYSANIGFNVPDNIASGTELLGNLLATAIAAPSTPVAGKSSVYVDSTQKVLSNKDDTGRVTVTVLPGTASTNEWIKGVSASGGLNAAQPAFSNLSGSVAASQMPALTGDVTSTAGTVATTLATVSGSVGTFGSATQVPQITVNGKGLQTNVTNVTITPAIGSVTGLGTGVATALGTAVGSAGAFVTNGGALGTPSSGVATNLTGTASGLTAGAATTTNQINSVDQTAAWSTYSPTFTCSSGTITSYTSQLGRYRLIGKSVLFHITVVLNNHGTCTGTISTSLPSTTANVSAIVPVFMGRHGDTGKMLQGYAQPNTAVATVANYDNTDLSIADGNTYYFQGSYETN